MAKSRRRANVAGTPNDGVLPKSDRGHVVDYRFRGRRRLDNDLAGLRDLAASSRRIFASRRARTGTLEPLNSKAESRRSTRSSNAEIRMNTELWRAKETYPFCDRLRWRANAAETRSALGFTVRITPLYIGRGGTCTANLLLDWTCALATVSFLCEAFRIKSARYSRCAATLESAAS